MKSKLILGISAVLVAILFFSFVGCERIDAGHVGLKVNMTGGNKGVAKTKYVTGWVFYTKGLTRVYEFPIYQQHVEYKIEDKPEDFVMPSKGGIPFILHPSFNYAINAGDVDGMFQALRRPLNELEMGYIKNAMRIALREITNSFSPDSILNNVSIYDASITAKLNKELFPYFNVTQFTSNLIPDESLRASIKDKARLIQEALALENEQKKIIIKAQNDVIEAKRDSTVYITGKLAEAHGITVVNEALRNSPQFVEKIKAERWNGVLPQYVLGNTSMFMQIPNK